MTLKAKRPFRRLLANTRYGGFAPTYAPHQAGESGTSPCCGCRHFCQCTKASCCHPKRHRPLAHGANAPSGLAWFQKNKQVVGKYSGQPGDIVFYNFSGNGVADHVGIIEGASKDGITTIEANTSPDHSLGSQANGGGVYRRHRPYLNVIAIVRPKYLVTVKPASSLAQNKKLAGGVAAATAVGGGGAATLNNHSADTVKAPTVISAPPFPGSSSFKIGSKNAAVKAVEDALFKAGLLPKRLDDGLYTKETNSAVKKYQAANLTLGKPDGIIGIKTYSSLTKG